MKIIEIKTTQNVVLQYELADLRDRILAFLIDFAVGVFGMTVLASFASNIFNGTTREVAIYFLLSLFIFYSLAFEALNNGQSLGKMALKIRVIKATSGRPTLSDYAARWVFRLVDVWFSFGGIASVLIASSSKSQRIGDIVANTAVVKLTPQMNLSLNDILSLHAPNDYKPEFAPAKQLVEEDALLIKNTLDRYRRFANPAHEEALEMLAKRVSEVLNLPLPSDNQKFLQAILRDYVMLTR